MLPIPKDLKSQLQYYGVAFLAIAVALFLTLTLKKLIGQEILLLFFAAVAVSSWYGGFKPGLLAIFGSFGVINYFLIPPSYTLKLNLGSSGVQLAGFIAVALLICLLNEALQSTKRRILLANERLEREIQEREQAQQALQASEALFRATFDQAAVGIGHFDRDGKCIKMNQRYCDIVGFTETQLLQMNFRDLTHPDDLETSQKYFQQLWENEIPNYAMERRYLHKNGSIVWVYLSMSLVQHNQGNLKYMVAVVEDISDQKRAEEELKESQAKFAGILDIASSAIISVDENQTIQLFNQGAEKIFGYQAKEVLGQNLDILLPVVYRGVHQQHIHSFAKTQGVPRQTAGSMRSIVGCRKDGEEFPAEASISQLKTRDGTLFTVMLNDISARRRAELALRESQRTLSTLMSNLPGMAYRCCNDLNWTMKFASEGCYELTGYYPEDLVDNDKFSYAQLIYAEDTARVWQKVQDAIANRQPFHILYRITTATGQLKWVWEQGQEVLSPQGESLLEGFITDITDRKQAEEALRQRENRLLRQQTAQMELVKHRKLYTGDLEAALRVITQTAAQTIGTERASIWFYNSTHSAISCVDLYQLTTATHSQGLELLAADYPAYFQELEADRVIAADQAQIDHRTQEFTPHYLLPLGITSMLDVPIRSGGQTVGVICLEHVGSSRTWSLEEQNFAAYLADMVALAIEARERKQAEEALQTREEQFRSLVTNIPGVFYRCACDADWTMEFISDEIFAITGYPATDYVSNRVRTFASSIHPEDRERVEAFVTEGVTTQRPFILEYRVIHADGSIRWVYEKGQGHFSDDGQMLWLDGAIFDISDRKRAEDALQQRFLREQLVGTMQERIRSSLNLEEVLTTAVEEVRQFLQTDRTLIYRFNPDWSGVVVVESVGEEWMPLSGLDLLDECFVETYVPLYQQGRIRAIKDIYNSDLDECHISLLDQFQVTANLVLPILQGGNLWGLLMAHHCNGPREWYSCEIESLKQLSVQLAIAIQQSTLFEYSQRTNRELSQTLNQLKATQQELIQSEKMAALGQLIAGVAHEINNPLGAIRPSVENIADFLSHSLEQLPTFFQGLSQERQLDFFTLLQKSSQKASLSTKEKRQFKRALIRQLEQQFLEDADTIADTLVDLGVYDEIEPFLPLLKDPDRRTILNTANQLVSLQTSTATITTAADRAAKVVFALKTYAHYDSRGEKVQTQVIDGIETVLTLYHNQLKQGVEVIKNYEADLPIIWGYADELNQVWTNLVHNALQAMDYKGTLTVDVKQKHSKILVSITDSGKGISEEIMPKIFEPFFTTKAAGEGSGLGLDIVKKIIDKHEGRIEVSSIPNKTTFTVTLPLS